MLSRFSAVGPTLGRVVDERLLGLDVCCDGRVGGHFVTCVGEMIEGGRLGAASIAQIESETLSV